MHIPTHILSGWVVANLPPIASRFSPRERIFCMIAAEDEHGGSISKSRPPPLLGALRAFAKIAQRAPQISELFFGGRQSPAASGTEGTAEASQE